MSYLEYLKSSDWKERRKELMEEAEGICDECGGKAKHIHHLRYDNLGDEILEEDVVALCEECHKEIHEDKEEQYGEYEDEDGYGEW